MLPKIIRERQKSWQAKKNIINIWQRIGESEMYACLNTNMQVVKHYSLISI